MNPLQKSGVHNPNPKHQYKPPIKGNLTTGRTNCEENLQEPGSESRKSQPLRQLSS